MAIRLLKQGKRFVVSISNRETGEPENTMRSLQTLKFKCLERRLYESDTWSMVGFCTDGIFGRTKAGSLKLFATTIP